MLEFIRAYRKRDPAAKSFLEVLLLYPGPKAIFFHRISHCLYKCGLYFLARLVAEKSRFITGIEIHPGAKIGKNCLVGAGSVVTEGKEFPDNALILGSPAKVVRIMDEAQIARLHGAAKHYVENGPRFAKGLKKIKD